MGSGQLSMCCIVFHAWYMSQINPRLVDFGGPISQRKRQILRFDNVEAIIYCVSLSDYDLTSQADETSVSLPFCANIYLSIGKILMESALYVPIASHTGCG